MRPLGGIVKPYSVELSGCLAEVALELRYLSGAHGSNPPTTKARAKLESKQVNGRVSHQQKRFTKPHELTRNPVNVISCDSLAPHAGCPRGDPRGSFLLVSQYEVHTVCSDATPTSEQHPEQRVAPSGIDEKQ